MNRTLDSFLQAAFQIHDNWAGKREVVPWGMVASFLPKSNQIQSDVAKKLVVALDLLGVRTEVSEGQVVLRPCYAKTGPFDQASVLARAVESRLFASVEWLAPESMTKLARYATGKAGQREAALIESLGRNGFLVVRRKLPTPLVQLRYNPSKEFHLARERQYVVSRPIAGDELLRRHFGQFPQYRSKSQRDVIHQLLDSDAASTTVARMPTGGGKSLTFLLPAAEWRRRGEPATCIVISPVIALMNDMMRKIEQEYGRTGLTAAEINSTVPSSERTPIYRKLRSGKLDVLFLSPEKAVEPFFRETLLESAEHVRLLVIDEAHMVREWGREFRTDFFRLGEIRRRLIERGARLKTLFLSATLTKGNERVLLDVFKASEGVVHFLESSLRRELSIRVSNHKGHEDKLAAIVPLLDRVLKPCIIYCGQKKHVSELQRVLNRDGLRRAITYTGNTPPEHRRERLGAFHNGDVDVVIATNAFGLGVDKSNVRTVIHFDVPHNLDAYYQEIGRCARDGRTGHALLLYSPGSMGHATKTQLSMLTSEKAVGRATAMLRQRFDLPADGMGVCLLPLHGLPAHIKKNGTLNQSWNAATLNLLEQVGDLNVGLRVVRHVLVTRGNATKWAQAQKDQANVIGCALIQDQLGRKASGIVDLARAAKKAKIAYLEAESAVIRIALRGAIDLAPLDEDKDEAWVLVRRNRDGTWTPSHTQRLEELRKDQMGEARQGVEELRRFVRGRECRLAAFAKIYDMPFTKKCGHCDRCDPALVM